MRKHDEHIEYLRDQLVDARKACALAQAKVESLERDLAAERRENVMVRHPDDEDTEALGEFARVLIDHHLSAAMSLAPDDRTYACRMVEASRATRHQFEQAGSDNTAAHLILFCHFYVANLRYKILVYPVDSSCLVCLGVKEKKDGQIFKENVSFELAAPYDNTPARTENRVLNALMGTSQAREQLAELVRTLFAVSVWADDMHVVYDQRAGGYVLEERMAYLRGPRHAILGDQLQIHALTGTSTMRV